MPDDRVSGLDDLKIALTTAIIIAHAAMTYGAAGTWVYEEPSLSGAMSSVLGALVGVGIVFGLGLLFLVSGLLLTPALQRRGPRRLLRSRLWRLGLPLVAYATVVWPLLRWWVDLVEGASGSFWSFYRFELGGDRWQSWGTGPLWFVAILLAVTTAWLLWRIVVPADDVVAEPMRPRHLRLAATTIAITTFVIRIWFPIDSPQFLDAHLWIWPQCATLFVFGAVGAERGWLTSMSAALRRLCGEYLVIAIVGLGALIVLSDGPDDFRGGRHPAAAGFAAFEGVVSVCLSLLILDRVLQHRGRPGAVRRRVAQATYGAFVTQGPVLVAIALALRRVDVPGDLKFLILATTAVTASFGLAVAADMLANHRTRPTRVGAVRQGAPNPSGVAEGLD